MDNTSCIELTEVKDWWLSREPAELISHSCHWPWKELRPTECLELWSYYYYLRDYGNRFRVLYTVDYACAAVGIIGNILALLTLSSHHFKQPSYVYHRALVGFDLVYSILLILHAWCFLNVNIIEKSYVATILRIIRMGPLLSASLTSDFISLSIATERMVAACLPFQYTKINSHSFAKATVGCAILCGFAGRIHYSLSFTPVPHYSTSTNSTIYNLAYSFLRCSRIYKAWYAISDELTPVAFIVVMITLTILTIRAILKRFLHRRHKPCSIATVSTAAPSSNINGPNQYIQAKPKPANIHQMHTRTATRLLMASTCMCLINQLGYVVYTVAWQIFDHTQVNFMSNKEEIENWLDHRRTYNMAYFMKGIGENLARVMYFYMNILISGQFRNEFMNWIKCNVNIKRAASTRLSRRLGLHFAVDRL